MQLTQERLKEELEYQPETGAFLWRKTGPGRRRREAGNRSREYVRIQIDGKLFYAHRLAFLYMTGRMPEIVDHKNGDTLDCRWDNLREINASDNAKNTSHVGYYRRGNRFRAQLTTDYKTYHLGSFGTAEEARAAYETAKRQEHRFWATGQGAAQAG